MKVNSRMRKYLADLRSREVGAAVPAAPAIHLVETKGLVLLRGFVQKPHGTLTEFPNETALECTANRLRMESMVEPRLARSAPLLLLTAGLVTAGAMASALRAVKGTFNVIVSYDGEGCAVRFHKLRAGQRWLMENLEEYEGQGILVFEAGPSQPAPMLLS